MEKSGNKCETATFLSVISLTEILLTGMNKIYQNADNQ